MAGPGDPLGSLDAGPLDVGAAEHAPASTTKLTIATPVRTLISSPACQCWARAAGSDTPDDSKRVRISGSQSEREPSPPTRTQNGGSSLESCSGEGPGGGPVSPLRATSSQVSDSSQL
jgi:hypothetical protein